MCFLFAHVDRFTNVPGLVNPAKPFPIPALWARSKNNYRYPTDCQKQFISALVRV